MVPKVKLLVCLLTLMALVSPSPGSKFSRAKDLFVRPFLNNRQDAPSPGSRSDYKTYVPYIEYRKEPAFPG